MAQEFSRFNNTEYVNVEGDIALGTWVKPSFLKNKLAEDQIGNFIVDSSYEGRPDLISNEIYGIPELFWVLIAFNNVTDINWPTAGDTVKYPLEQFLYIN